MADSRGLLHVKEGVDGTCRIAARLLQQVFQTVNIQTTVLQGSVDGLDADQGLVAGRLVQPGAPMTSFRQM